MNLNKSILRLLNLQLKAEYMSGVQTSKGLRKRALSLYAKARKKADRKAPLVSYITEANILENVRTHRNRELLRIIHLTRMFLKGVAYVKVEAANNPNSTYNDVSQEMLNLIHVSLYTLCSRHHRGVTFGMQDSAFDQAIGDTLEIMEKSELIITPKDIYSWFIADMTQESSGFSRIIEENLQVTTP